MGQRTTWRFPGGPGICSIDANGALLASLQRKSRRDTGRRGGPSRKKTSPRLLEGELRECPWKIEKRRLTRAVLQIMGRPRTLRLEYYQDADTAAEQFDGLVCCPRESMRAWLGPVPTRRTSRQVRMKLYAARSACIDMRRVCWRVRGLLAL